MRTQCRTLESRGGQRGGGLGEEMTCELRPEGQEGALGGGVPGMRGVRARALKAGAGGSAPRKPSVAARQ